MTLDAYSLSPAASMQQHSPKSTLAKLCRKLSSRKGGKRSLSSSSGSSCSSDVMEKVFGYFDENGDGKISPAELQTCVRTVGGELSDKEAHAAVEVSDTDGDGMLGFEEFQRLMEAENGDEENRTKELRDAFRMYEMEGSGCITPASLKRMLCRLGETRSVDDCKSMIQMFDLNGDGVLNFEEFRIMMAWMMMLPIVFLYKRF